MISKSINLYASAGCVLYKILDELLPDGEPDRYFTESVTIPVADEPLWHECLLSERDDWEHTHKPIDPEPEPNDNDNANPDDHAAE